MSTPTASSPSSARSSPPRGDGPPSSPRSWHRGAIDHGSRGPPWILATSVAIRVRYPERSSGASSVSPSMYSTPILVVGNRSQASSTQYGFGTAKPRAWAISKSLNSSRAMCGFCVGSTIPCWRTISFSRCPSARSILARLYPFGGGERGDRVGWSPRTTGGDHANPTGDDDTPSRAVPAALFAPGVGARGGAPRRNHPDARLPHSDRCPARDGPRPEPAVPALPPRPQPRRLVRPCRESGAAGAPHPGVRARRPRCPRGGRDAGTAARRQDRGQRHLPRPGALQSQPLRQSQRPALGVPDVAGADPLGGPRLGAAVPGGPGPVRALRPRTPAAAQAADDLGRATAPARPALVAPAGARGRRRQHLRLPGAA